MTQFYLKLDQRTWQEGDYTSDTTLALSGTIYTDEEFSTAATLTGYTLTLRLYTLYGNFSSLEETADIVAAASGTWRYNPAEGEMPQHGVYMAKMELAKSGTVVSTINRQELYIRRGQ